ncbi:uncharacterized protein ACNFOS_010818 [Eudromia elegans]
MDQSMSSCCDELDESESSENEDEKTEEGNTEVILETKDFKVTSACASGYCEPSNLEVPERHKKLLSSDTDDSLAKIMAEESEASKDGTGEDEQDETWLSDSWSPTGIRKRPEKEDEQPQAQTVETFKAEKDTLMLEKDNCRARVAAQEASRSMIPMPVRIAIFAAFVFVLFVYVTMEIDPKNPIIDLIMGRI